MRGSVEMSRGGVVHSDPAATIKIGGVRCLHSSLCKSHQPEPFVFLAADYIIIRLAGSRDGSVPLHHSCCSLLLQCTTLWQEGEK